MMRFWRNLESRPLSAAWVGLVCLCLVSCGGSGSNTSQTTNPSAPSNPTNPTNPTTPLGTGPSGASCPVLASGTNPLPSAKNAVSIYFDPCGSVGSVNIPYVSVQVCSIPSSSASTPVCQTIDHITVDTGSHGLRILSSAMSQKLLAALPFETPSSVNAAPAQGTTLPTGNPALWECYQFVSSYVWGSVRRANLTLNGETASNLQIQVIDKPSSPAVPSGCSKDQGSQEATPTDVGSNGILGIGSFDTDCDDCTTVADPTYYYACASGQDCVPVAVPSKADQVLNPVALLPVDKQGVVIQLKSVATINPRGLDKAAGQLIFGIGTQTNNTPASGTVTYQLDNIYGFLAANVNGVNYVDNTDPNAVSQCTGSTQNPSSQTVCGAYLDTGSNGLFFRNDGMVPLPTLNACPNGADPGFYCTPSNQTLTASFSDSAGHSTNGKISIVIQSATTILNSWASADAPVSDGLAGCSVASGSSVCQASDLGVFDFGLPFFFGRTVSVVMGTRSGDTSVSTPITPAVTF